MPISLYKIENLFYDESEIFEGEVVPCEQGLSAAVFPVIGRVSCLGAVMRAMRGVSI